MIDAWTSRGRLAVSELDAAPAATWTTSAMRSSRSSTRTTRPPPIAPTAGWPANRRAATARWWSRCCAPTCSAASPRTPATPCLSAATRATSPRSPGACATTSTAPSRYCWPVWRHEPTFDWARYGGPLSIYAYACAYSPDPDRPGEALLPFDLTTGRLVPDVWAQWLALDPVRMAELPRRRAARPAPDLPRCRSPGRVLPRPRGAGLLLGALAPRHRAHARAVRRTPRRHLVSLPAGDPRAGHGTGMSRRPPRPSIAFAGPVALAALRRARRRSAHASWSSSSCGRIEALDPRLNAFRTVIAEEALAAADAMTEPEWAARRGADRAQG